MMPPMREGVPPVEESAAELWSRETRLLLWALLLVGAAAFPLGALGAQPRRAWQIYLVNELFWSGLGVAGAVMAAIWRATNSQWGRRLQGAALGTLGFLPVALLAFLPLIAGRAHIFPWLAHLNANRAAWLEPGFLLARNFFSLALLYVFSAAFAYVLLRPAAGAAWRGAAGADPSVGRGLRGWVVRNWRGAAEEGARADRAVRWMTPVLLILYALVMSLTAFDLVMPLDPTFASTLFGGYYFVTNLYSGWALLAVLLGVWLTRHGGPKQQPTIASDDLHQLGKLIFGFSMLYGMVFWSQYLVIWYGNLLEEIPYVILRQHIQPWATVSFLMIFASLVVPFCILLSRAVKRNSRALAGVGALILMGMWLERYVLVVPSLWRASPRLDNLAAAGMPNLPPNAGVSPSLPLGLLELAVTAGFAAAFLLCYGSFVRTFPITLGPPGAPGHHAAH